MGYSPVFSAMWFWSSKTHECLVYHIFAICVILCQNLFLKVYSIGQVKRDISDLVNRVAYAGERIILTACGRPKAALVSIDDYELLLLRSENCANDIQGWLTQARALSSQIETRRGQPVDVDFILFADCNDLENRQYN